MITEKEFLDKVPLILQRDELEPLFKKYAAYSIEGGANTEPLLTAYAFKKFLL